MAGEIPTGPVLCLAEGQGRNAVYLASLGHPVTALDRSAAGLARAGELAAGRGVSLELLQVDLATYRIAPGAWAGIVAIFAHLPPTLRRAVHRDVVAGLRPGGVFVLEAYTPRQLRHGTGGPRDETLLMTLAALEEELRGLDFLVAREIEREIHEGRYHAGLSAVVQILGRKPARS